MWANFWRKRKKASHIRQRSNSHTKKNSSKYKKTISRLLNITNKSISRDKVCSKTFRLILITRISWLTSREKFNKRRTNSRTLLAIISISIKRLKANSKSPTCITKNNKSGKSKSFSGTWTSIQAALKALFQKMTCSFTCNTHTKKFLLFWLHNLPQKIIKSKKRRKATIWTKLSHLKYNNKPIFHQSWGKLEH